MERGPLVVVLGATATGKSTLAVALARRLGGEVVNADSRQVYRHLDIGTAKPAPAERGGVPHHLFDLVDPEGTYCAAKFRTDAVRVAAEVTGRGALPIVVGGSGLYLRALDRGLFEGPGRDRTNHARLEAIAARGGLDRLRRWLGRVDPERAERIGRRDRQRILRALDVYLQSGRSMSDLMRDAGDAPVPFRSLRIGLAVPRAELYRRIDRRVEAMLALGLLDEVRRLLERPGFAASNAAKAVGYRQLVAHLAGRSSLAEAVASIQRDTRRLAKRQMTWFRKEPGVHWVPASDPGEALVEAESLVRRWLRGVPLPGEDRALGAFG